MRLKAFRDALHELGYVEGKNVQLEVRWGNGEFDRLPALAAELVQLKVDVIVAATSPSVVAARQATRTIPIVMPVSSDPVGEGLVASLAHPGGNITGLSMMAPELGEKRLQLLRETFPEASRAVAVLWNPAYAGMRARFEEAKVAAPKLGLTARSVEVRDTRQHRLPAIYESSDFVDAGGLMSFGPNISNLYRGAAVYVDKILKGAKPGDLPIEQPTKFELVLNMKTAKALGISFPTAVLLRADKLIE